MTGCGGEGELGRLSFRPRSNVLLFCYAVLILVFGGSRGRAGIWKHMKARTAGDLELVFVSLRDQSWHGNGFPSSLSPDLLFCFAFAWSGGLVRFGLSYSLSHRHHVTVTVAGETKKGVARWSSTQVRRTTEGRSLLRHNPVPARQHDRRTLFCWVFRSTAMRALVIPSE